MPIDPHLAGVLQMLATAKPTAQGTPAESRAGYFALTKGSLTPEQTIPVASAQDTTVPGAEGSIPARIYRPEDSGLLPTVAYFHGGGYVIGNLDTHDNMCREICRGARAVVVSVDYRLAPEHPFPAGIEDAVAATKWVAANARELGGSGVVAVAGDSAGANFSAVVAQQLREAGTPLDAQFLIYPAVDHAAAVYPSAEQNAKGYFLEVETMAWFYNHYAGTYTESLDPRLAPLQAKSLAHLPPAVIVTAEFDPLRDQGVAYADALRAAGGQAELIEGPGMIHGFFDMGRWSPGAQAIITHAIGRFGELLREQSK